MTEFAPFLRLHWPDWLSMLSGLLLLASFARPAWPRGLWAWLLCSGLLLIAATLGLLPVDLAAYGYPSNGWRELLGPALWVGVTVGIAAAGNLWLGLLMLLPALFWRIGLSPAPELLENYLDAPLMLAALYQVIRHGRRSPSVRRG